MQDAVGFGFGPDYYCIFKCSTVFVKRENVEPEKWETVVLHVHWAAFRYLYERESVNS